MADVLNDYSTGLVSCWMTDSTGITTDLVTATANNLTNNNSVGTTTGKNGNAGDFSGSNTLSDGDNSSYDITGDLSLAFWWNPDSLNVHTIFDKWIGSGGNRSYQMKYNESNVNADTFHFFVSSDGTTSNQDIINLTWGSSFSTGTWYHIVLTYDASASAYELFVNGSSADTATGSENSIYSGSAGPIIGGSFNGQLHQLLLYNTKISSAYASGLYNGGSGVYYEDPNPAASDNALALCNF